MSVAGDERAVVDAGLKSMSERRGRPGVHGRGGLECVGLSDEHGKMKMKSGTRPKLGEKVMLVPGHCDPTVNLHDWYVGVRRGRVEALWPITARGAVDLRLGHIACIRQNDSTNGRQT